jgi:hypothetical protein
MPRSLTFVLVACNAAAIVAAIVAYALVHQRDRALDVRELERGVATKLSSVATPAEMQSSSAAVAKMTSGAVQAVQGAVTVIDACVGFLVFVGAFNVIFMMIGVREGKKRAATQSV